MSRETEMNVRRAQILRKCFQDTDMNVPQVQIFRKCFQDPDTNVSQAQLEHVPRPQAAGNPVCDLLMTRETL